MAPPFREAEFDIIFGEGISREGDVLDLAAGNGIIEKSGAWYSYKGDRIGQGRDNSRVFLKENPEVMARLKTMCAPSWVSWLNSRKKISESFRFGGSQAKSVSPFVSAAAFEKRTGKETAGKRFSAVVIKEHWKNSTI